MNATARLAVALSLSGFALAATSSGPYAFALCALFAAAPMLVATRCLPLWLALPVALVPVACGRALAFHGAFGNDPTPALATAALVPALLLDRFATTWAPRTALLSWPCALVVTERVLSSATSSSAAATLVPAPALDAIQYVAGDVGIAGGTLVAAVLANGFALLGGNFNRKIFDPHTQEERESGVKLGAISALVLGIALFAAAAVRAHVAAPPAPPTSPGDGVVVACVVGVVGVFAAAFVRRTKRKAAPAARTA